MDTVFILPEGAERPEDYLAGNPQLVENLRALVGSDEELLEQRQSESEDAAKAASELARQEGEAAGTNALLDELTQKHARLEALQGQETQIAAQAEEYQAAERALHAVKPCADALSRAEQMLRQTHADIEAKSALLEQQQTALAEARRASEADVPKREQAEQLAAEAAKLRDSLPGYIALAEQTKALAAQQAALEDARKRAGELDGRQAEQSKALTALREELKTLEGSEAEAVRLAQEHDGAKERLDALTTPGNGICFRVEAILSDESSLTGKEQTLRTLATDAFEAERRYHELYQTFLSGQAGSIAVKMERELAETGRTVCPVCNTLFCTGDAHRFALPAEHIPQEPEVDQAEAEAKKAEKRRRDMQEDIETQRKLLAQQKELVAADTRKLDPDCNGWGALTAPGYLPGLQLHLEQGAREAEVAWRTAKTSSDRRKELLRQEPEQTAALEELEKQRNAAREETEGLLRTIHGAESAIGQLRIQLPFPDEAAAQAKLETITAQRMQLQREITEHEQAVTAAKEAADGTEGGLNTLRDALPEQKRASEDARIVLTRKLEETGFADLAAADAALAPIGSGDGERWLTERKQALDDYGRELETTRKRIGELEEQTAGKARIDLEALKAGLKEAEEARRSATERLAEQQGVLLGHQRVLDRVANARTALAATDHAYSRISRLAALAVGASSDVGKLSFDRYVMGSIFREVLEHANRRLDVMTGGRFALIHVVDAGRKNSVAGLEVEVLDRETGRQRASGSISGGEGFLVSLALALGLSDVVQSHAGGQKLDTLFIDEGFGTLDEGKLDSVISVLQQLTEGNRLVGVISHVDKLEESIPQKLRVSSGPHGSTLELELS